MSASNSRSASLKRRKNANPRSRRKKLISQEKSRLANVQYPVEKSLRLKPLTFPSIHRPIESRASSSSAKQSWVARFRKSRRKNFSPQENPISSKASSRNVDDPSPPI